MMEMAIRRFDFEGLQDFSLPLHAIEIANDHTLPKEAEELAPPLPPSFSESELEAAKKMAYAEGLQAGELQEKERQDAQAKANEEATLLAMNKLCEQASVMQQNIADFKKTQVQELSGLLQMLVEKIAGDTISAAPHKAIEAMIDDCLCVLQEEPRIVIQVHPQCFAAIEEKLRIVAAQHHIESSITLRENTELGLSDIRMNWGNGHAERSLRDIWQKIEEMIGSIDFSKLADMPASSQAQTTQEETQQGEDNE